MFKIHNKRLFLWVSKSSTQERSQCPFILDQMQLFQGCSPELLVLQSSQHSFAQSRDSEGNRELARCSSTSSPDITSWHQVMLHATVGTASCRSLLLPATVWCQLVLDRWTLPVAQLLPLGLCWQVFSIYCCSLELFSVSTSVYLLCPCSSGKVLSRFTGLLDPIITSL